MGTYLDQGPWLHFWEASDAAHAHDIMRGLAVVGRLNLPLNSDGAPEGAGIVCFSRFSEALCIFINEVSCCGRERVLAVATSSDACERSQAWNLLKAGASDVLAWTPNCSIAERIKALFERWSVVDALLDSPAVRDRLVGSSPRWRSTLRRIACQSARNQYSMPIHTLRSAI